MMGSILFAYREEQQKNEIIKILSYNIEKEFFAVIKSPKLFLSFSKIINGF
jgi:hypothetical protein